MLTTIYRFTPPTCTLEIKGEKSPLSRWTNQDILQEFQFKLSLDDPRKSTDQQIIITGDRTTLEQLTNLVDKYIQNNLHGSLNPRNNIEKELNQKNNYPYLKAKGLTNHDLYFGNLKHNSTAQKITLSTVQLFDLLTALEAYSSKISALPKAKQTQSKKALSLWSGVAALAFITVGIATIVLRNAPIDNIASSPQSQSLDTPAEFDDIIPPNIPPESNQKPRQPKISESISSAKRLPPPPAVETPKPKPNIPDPADYSLSEIARQSGLKYPVKQSEIEQEEGEQAESIISPTAGVILETSPKSESETKVEKFNHSGANNSRTNSSTNFPEEFNVADSSSQNIPDVLSQPSQSQEITAYFQEKWQPPKDLKQSLEYRLYLNPDGTIKRVIPIGKASELYLNSTNIPVKGEKFISPLNQSSKSIVRLLLNPDGGVKTLTE